MTKSMKALLIVAMMGLLASCSYTTVKPNEAGVKIYDGKFAEQVKPGRHGVTSPFHEVEIVKWKGGIALSIFTASANEGDRAGDDSIKVSSLEAASVQLDVTAQYRIDPTQTECLYKANLVNNDAIRDNLIRPAVQDAFASISSFVPAKDIKTTRKAELANVALVHLQERFGQKPIGKESKDPIPLTSADMKMVQTHPVGVIPQKTACGIAIESVLIPLVTLPENIQASVDQAITAEADAQTITVKQKSATAEAERIRIEAEGNAAKVQIDAQAQADANAKISASMSPGLIELEKIKACAEALAKTQAKVASCGSTGGGAYNPTVVIPAG